MKRILGRIVERLRRLGAPFVIPVAVAGLVLVVLIVVAGARGCNRGPDAESLRRTATVAEALRPSFFAAALRRLGGAHFRGTTRLAAWPAPAGGAAPAPGGVTTTTDVWLDRGGSYHLSELNDSDGGRDVFFTGRELAVALRYGKMIRRTAEEPEPKRLLEEALSGPWAAWEVVGSSAVAENAGTELFGGARATKYRLARSKEPLVPVTDDSQPAPPVGLRAWRGTVSVTSLTGELVIDDATGALMKADISAAFSLQQEGRPFRGAMEAHTVLTEVATTVPIERPPAEDLALRQRTVPEQRELLKGLSSSPRVSEPPAPRPPAAPKRRGGSRGGKP